MLIWILGKKEDPTGEYFIPVSGLGLHDQIMDHTATNILLKGLVNRYFKGID